MEGVSAGGSGAPPGGNRSATSSASAFPSATWERGKSSPPRRGALIRQSRRQEYSHDPFSLGPMLVTAAFSAELYLKCLIALQLQNITSGHDLVLLFDQLNKTTKAKLERLYREDSKVQEIIRAAPSAPKNMRDDLRANADNFSAWRYRYETHTGKARIDNMGNLRRILRSYLLSLNPDWLQGESAYFQSTFHVSASGERGRERARKGSREYLIAPSVIQAGANRGFRLADLFQFRGEVWLLWVCKITGNCLPGKWKRLRGRFSPSGGGGARGRCGRCRIRR